MNTVYLNGQYLPLEEARIPVLDRGFIFGDAVYEVIPVYGRRPFRLAEHLKRLRRSLEAIRLDLDLDDARLSQLIAPIIEQAEWSDQGIYLQVTRGPAPRDLAILCTAVPTVFIMAMPLSAPNPASIEHGVSAITARDDRWLHCDVKTTSLVANVLLRQRSVDAGCAETILLRDGWLTEGTASNVFVVIEGRLHAPPNSEFVLPGVTHDVVLELAERHRIPTTLRPIDEAELRTADEIWLTSSTKEVTAVSRLDGAVVGNGRPGPIYLVIHKAYDTFKNSEMRRP